MTAPEVDLTAAVDAAARKMYIKSVELQVQQGERRTVVAAVARREWDRDKLPAAAKTFWRRIALAGLSTAVSSIARQAWDLGVDAAMDNVLNADVADTSGPHNPWADDDMDDELRKMTGE